MDDVLRPKPNFFDAFRGRTRKVVMGRKDVVLEVPKLGKHALYQISRRALTDCPPDEDPVKKMDLFCECLRSALSDEHLTLLLPEEVPLVVLAVEDLFSDPPPLAWQEPLTDAELKERDKSKEVSVEDNLSYDGRSLSFLITTICSVFGWTADYVLNHLTLYEASIYMQEALLLQYQEQEWTYMLSQVGFKEVGKKMEKQPLPSPAWVKKRMLIDRSKLTPVPDRFLPGNPGDEIQEFSYDPKTGAVNTHAVSRPKSSIAEDYAPAPPTNAPKRGLTNFGANP